MSGIVRAVKIGSPAALPSRTRLSIADGISFNEWADIGRELQGMAESIAWWIGDWYAYGVHAYRKDYAAGVEKFERSWQGLADLAYVSRSVHPSRRREDVSWSHHREVAPLEPDAQDEWLEEVVANSLSVRELREQIRAGRPAPRAPLEPGYRSLRTLLGDGELELVTRAAEHRGIEPHEWARVTLEQAARAELAELPALATINP